MNLKSLIAVTLCGALCACTSLKTAAYSGAGAAAGAAAAGGIAYAASGGNFKTTAIAGAAGAVGGAIVGGLWSGAQQSKKQAEFNKGYELGQSDTVKRQYWMARNLQKSTEPQSPYQTRFYTFNMPESTTHGVNYTPYSVTVPIVD
ncbi:MAG TPA: hypothetical protein VIS99_12785 [Terrimicrobiaceae bacterium]